MRLRDVVGDRAIALLQGAVDQDGPLVPPQIGAPLIVGGVAQQLDGAVVVVMAAAIAHPFIDQARIVLDAVRQLGGQRDGVGGVPGQGEARLGEQFVIRIDPAGLLARRRVLMLPQQAIEAGEVVLIAEQGPESIEEGMLLRIAESAGDP